MRDQALLELLYATGMRVSECCTLTVGDLDLFMDTVLVHGKGKKRAISRSAHMPVMRWSCILTAEGGACLKKQKSLMMCCLSIKEAAR